MAAHMRVFAVPALVAAHPCDSEQGTACPFSAGAELGECLQDPGKHEETVAMSDACTSFISVNNACAKEIDDAP